MKNAKRTVKREVAEESTVSDQTLRGFIGYNMKRAFNMIQADLVKTLEPFDLRMVTYSALVMIVDNPGLRQAQLADALAIERPNLVVIVDELERRELIMREQSPTDRRAYALKATLAGTRLCEKAVKAVRAHEDNIFSDVSDDFQDELLKALNAIEAKIKEKRS